MAKNKRSKILAMALCAGVMAGIYASPVMAAKVDVTSGNLTGVTTQNNRDYSFTGGTLNLDDANIAGALNGQNVNLGTGAITANGITSTAGITAANGQFQVYGRSGGIAATSLSLLNNGSQNVLITNSGMARFGDSNSENVRIEDGVLRVFDGKTELASLTSNGLTLNDGTVQGSLTATQLATINSAITTQNNKTVITGDELNIKGATGGLYVRDVVDGKTMIYTKAADADGTNTVWIDPENGNISTIGTVGVTDDLESGKLITQIQGSGENIGDIAVGIQYDGEGNITGQNIVLDASTGDVIAKGTLSGTGLAAEGASGGLYVRDVVDGKTMIYTKAADADGTNTVWIDPENGNISTIGTVGVTDDLESGKLITQIQGSGENIGDIAVGIQYDGEGNITGQNIVLDASTGDVISKGDVTTLNDDGSEKYSLNTIGEQVDGIGADLGDNGRLGGITREDKIGNDGKLDTTTIEGTTSFDANGMRVSNENDGRGVAITKDRGIEVFGGDGASTAVIGNNGNARFGAEKDANVRIQNGGVYVNSSYNETEASLTGEGLTLGENVLNETQLGNINNMITGAGVLENVISINGAAVEGVGDGGLKISEVTLEKGGIWAEKLNGRLISEYVTDDEISGDLENIGGIDRKDVTGEGKPGEGTTTIENLLNVSGDSVSASLGKNSFTFDNSGFKFTGVVNLGSASDIYFNYGGVGNGTDYAGSYTLEDLADTVADIYDRTQAIDYENGKTTIKGDLDVVKDPNAGSGEGGDPGTGEGGNTGNGNGHYDGNLDVDGGITAGDSTIGGVGLEGGTVTADKVVTGNTTLDNEGLNVGGQTSVTADGVNVGGNGGTTVSKDGVSIADKTIISDHDVVINEGTADRVSLSETADRVGNLEQGVSELNNRVGELEDRIDKVGAMAAAIANLRTMGYDPAAPTEVAVGIGQYRDETGAALGLFHYPNRDFMLSLSVSTSGDEVMGGIGATWKFGRKSPEKVAEIKKAQAEADARRAEEAKLAKAEEMKQAAKEAKIKAQQERHAKLAAERAAQAEAAK